jgi:hypothetical protein
MKIDVKYQRKVYRKVESLGKFHFKQMKNLSQTFWRYFIFLSK